MPHLADVLDLVAQLDGFLQSGGAPRTGQGALMFGVCAQVGSLRGKFFAFLLFHKFKGVHVRLDVGRGLLEVGPLTFPHFNDVVALGTKTGHFVLGVLVNRMHGTLAKAEMFFATYGIALGTTVPETPVEFVHGVGLAMETVDGEGGARYVILAGIADVLNVMVLTGMRMVWISAGHLVVSFKSSWVSCSRVCWRSS